MSFSAGVFTPSLVGAAKIEIADIVQTSRISEMNLKIVAGAAILGHQDPTISTVGFGEQCINADIITMRSGTFDTGNKTIACDIPAGVEAATEKLTLAKTILVDNESFFIKDNLCANAIDFGKLLGYNLMKAKVSLEVKISKMLVALASTNADVPVAAWFETTGTVAGTTYQIAKANFSSAVLGDALYAADVTNMVSPIVLNGRNLYNAAKLAEFESLGCCTTNAALQGGLMQLYWDALNVDQVTAKKSTLVIDKNALLFWSSPVFSNLGLESAMDAGKEAADRYHYVDVLPRLTYMANGSNQPIYVNVRLQRTCEKAGGDLYPVDGWRFHLSLSGAVTPNLTNQDDLQGIIHIEQVA